jgi:hypothetical protein
MDDFEAIDLMFSHTLELKKLLENQRNGIPFKNDGFLKHLDCYHDYNQIIPFFVAQIQLEYKYFIQDKHLLAHFFEKLKDEEITLLDNVFNQTQWDSMKINYEKLLLEKNIDKKLNSIKIKL